MSIRFKIAWQKIKVTIGKEKSIEMVKKAIDFQKGAIFHLKISFPFFI
jgi:hypothetical protein